MFIYNPTLLWVGASTDILFDALVAIVGVVVCACGLAGFFTVKLNILQRLMCIAGGLLLILPGLITDLVGIGIAVVALASRKISAKNVTAHKTNKQSI